MIDGELKLLELTYLEEREIYLSLYSKYNNVRMKESIVTVKTLFLLSLTSIFTFIICKSLYIWIITIMIVLLLIEKLNKYLNLLIKELIPIKGIVESSFLKLEKKWASICSYKNGGGFKDLELDLILSTLELKIMDKAKKKYLKQLIPIILGIKFYLYMGYFKTSFTLYYVFAIILMLLLFFFIKELINLFKIEKEIKKLNVVLNKIDEQIEDNNLNYYLLRD